MTERGILFTPENYGKVEGGSKTQTRRIVKPQPVGDVEWFGCYRSSNPKQDGRWAPMKGDPKDTDCWETAEGPQIICPYGLPGDRLYVKEGLEKYPQGIGYGIRYRRDKYPVRAMHHHWGWTKDTLSPLHMPHWAARLWLELTDVQVEQILDINEEDAMAEGCEAAQIGPVIATPRAMFRVLWESINGEDSWKQNPFVWVLTFKKVTT